jgi:hypothetical protein
MVPGVAITELGKPEGPPLAGIGSLMVFVGMVFFTIIVFRTARNSTYAGRAPVGGSEWAR